MAVPLAYDVATEYGLDFVDFVQVLLLGEPLGQRFVSVSLSSVKIDEHLNGVLHLQHLPLVGHHELVGGYPPGHDSLRGHLLDEF